MSLAANQKDYTTQWKNEVSAILYGPVGDVYSHPELVKRMRQTITDLCQQIDEVGEILEKEGTFNKSA